MGLAFVSLLVAAPTADAGSKRPVAVRQSMTVAASPQAASAHPVRLAMTFHYQMQCGYPGSGPLVVTFPKALRLPKQLVAGAVRLAGIPITTTVNGRRVSMTIAPPTGVLCSMVGPSSLRLVFTRRAKLANPGRPGSYRFTVAHTTHRFTAMLTIGPAG